MHQDAEALEAWRSGDASAGKALFARHYKTVALFFFTKVGDEQASDLIQLTFLGCLEARARIRDGSRFRSYLLGIARNVLYEFFRTKKKLANIDFTQHTVEDMGAPSPTSLMGRAREIELLVMAMRRLPMESQLILELHYWEGMKVAEVAEILDVPLGTAKSRMRKARSLLETQLRRVSRSPELFKSTMSDLDDWAIKIRAAVKQ